MTHRFLAASLATLTQLAAGMLFGQDPPELASLRASLADAALELRASEPGVVIGAIARIAGLTNDADAADRLAIVRVLASVLESTDTVVVTAAVDALARVPNRSAGIAGLTNYLATLTAALRRAPAPRWPAPTPGDLEVPRVPPLPPMEGKPSSEYRRQLREYEQAEKEREKKLARDLARREREWVAAEADDLRLRAAAARLATFAGCLTNMHQDAVVDGLLVALHLTLDRAPTACAPIVGALAATGRRDAVDMCVAILAKPDTLSRCLQLQLARGLARIGLPTRPGEAAGAAAPDPASFDFIVAVKKHLVSVGVRHGVAVPDAATGRDQARRLMGIEGDETGPHGTSNPWMDWFQRIAPQLPERLGTDSGTSAPAARTDGAVPAGRGREDASAAGGK